MNYSKAMVIKISKKWFVLPLSFILFGCPGEDFSCVTQNIRIENLAKIEPVQQVYHLGDTIIYSIAIPSHIENYNDDGTIANIFQETRNMEALIEGFQVYKLEENTLEVLEGRLGTIQETTVAYVSYFQEDNNYRFKVRIIFNQIGTYSLIALNNNRLIFDSGNEDCAEYEIKTSTQGVNQNGEFNFEVIE
jgi:hypothetical protein